MRTPRVVLTLSDGGLPGLAQTLPGLGVAVESAPLLRVGKLPDTRALDLALLRLEEFAAVAVTSPRAARIVGARISQRSSSLRRNLPPFWAVGPSTALALGFPPPAVRLPHDQVPGSDRGARRLADSMVAAGVGSSVLFPCGEHHRNELPDRLRRAGVEVEETVCYRMVLATRAEAHAACRRGEIVVVASARVVRLLAESVPPASRPWLVAIGNSSAEAAMRAGWRSLAVVSEPSADRVREVIRLLLTALA